MNRVQDGITIREHLEQVEKQVGYIEELHVEPPPIEIRYLWNWYCELDMGRGSSWTGPANLSYLDIDAWCRLSGINLDPWELKVIKSLDLKYLSTINKKG